MTAHRPAPAQDADLDEDQLRRLLRVIPVVSAGATIGALVACYPYLAKRSLGPVLAWLGVFSLVSLARIGGSIYYSRDGAGRLASGTWYRWAAAGAMAHAVLWGACSFVLFDFADASAESVLHIVLASVAMGAAVHLSGFFPLLVAYVSCVIGPLVLRDIWIGSSYHLLLAFMCAVAGIYAISTGRNQSRALIEILAQRRKNAELIEALRVENQRSEAARRTAEDANAAKSRFFAAANHDLRQPLHAMGLLAQTLRAHASQVDVDEVSGHLVECVDGMTQVVDELLEITRLDVGNIAPQWTAFAIDGLLRETAYTYQALARAKGLQLELRADSGTVVHSDRALLGRVLANLVSNAIRYTPHGTVRLAASAGEQHAAVSVEDSGIGIAAEHLPRIFEEFYQVANPARDRRLGLGLGLATVKRLSDLLSLDVAVDSTPGAGSTFHLTVTRARADEHVVESELAEEPAPLPTAQRVLVIEDDADSRNALLGLLHQWGCAARGAPDAAEALPWLGQGFVPDALLVDLRLANGASGLDAIAALRAAAGCELPALILTGDVASERAREAQALGFLVLIKPAKPMQLRAFLGQAFASH
jgi:two-component system, sensor histidine kinase